MGPGKPYKIFLYNKFFGQNEEIIFNHPIIDGFDLTNDLKYIDQAVAIIFHMPTLPQGHKMLKKSIKKSGQLWVFWSKECEVHYKWQYEMEVMDLFDITMTYKLNSDIPLPYFNNAHDKLLRHEPVSKKGFINAFISSNFDQSHRIKHLKELMSYVDVDSYGKVLNNKTLMKDKGAETKKK